MQQSALEYLISKTLHAEEIYLDDDGNLTDTPKIRYVTMYHSHVDLTKFVDKAREIDKKNNYK